MAEGMTVTELADTVGMTPRNIRAYQSRGLLFPPTISGRVALYSGAHVARLELIASLQREGFTLAAIKRLITTPSSYSAIVADRRRRFRDGSSDIVRTVPIPEEPHPHAAAGPAGRTSPRPAWPGGTASGQLVSHTLLVAVGRMLSVQGVPLTLVSAAAARRGPGRPRAGRGAAGAPVRARGRRAQPRRPGEGRRPAQRDRVRDRLPRGGQPGRAGARDATSRPEPRGQSVDLDDHLDLDRDVQRQHRHADRAARVHARVAEHLAEQLAGAVDDAGLAGEVRGARDEADDLDDPAYLVEVADLGLDGGERVERAGLRRASLACSASTSAPTLPVASARRRPRQLAGGVDQVAGAHGRHVGRERRGVAGQRQAELGQPLARGCSASARLR